MNKTPSKSKPDQSRKSAKAQLDLLKAREPRPTSSDPVRDALRSATSDRIDAAMASFKKAFTPHAPVSAKKSDHAVSPLAPKAFPSMPVIKGLTLAQGTTGIRYKDRHDLMLALTHPDTTVAGVFTTSKTRSAAIDWCKDNLKHEKSRLMIVNAGNSNAFTGKKGIETVEKVCSKAAKLLKCETGQVYMASTGVIGEPLPYKPFFDIMPELLKDTGEQNWEEAARAIMTTDTFPKGCTRTAKIGDTVVHINGICKGSGMIAPDMATMLAFVFTDAAIPAPILQTLLMLSVKDSFNCITVDSDTSTSDTLMLAATGQAEHQKITRPADPILKDFREKLHEVILDLAHQVVKDGEGATKFVTIDVKGAESPAAARKIALSIGNSPLVKTAIAGEDANWGRIVAAVGKSGEYADRDKLTVKIGGVIVAENGERAENYDEAPVSAHMKGDHVHIEVHVGIGRGTATVWTCDLTKRYVEINGDYRS